MPRRTHPERRRLKELVARARRAQELEAYGDWAETPPEAAVRLVRLGTCSPRILDGTGELRAALGPRLEKIWKGPNQLAPNAAALLPPEPSRSQPYAKRPPDRPL